MFFSTKKDLATRFLLMTLVVATLSLALGESTCSGFNSQREHCERQEGLCQWNRRQNKCLPIPTWEKCAEKKKRLQCRKQGCVWKEVDRTCLSTHSVIVANDQTVASEDKEVIVEDLRKSPLRSLKADEDVRPQTRPFFLDEEGGSQSNVDKDIRPQTRPLFLDGDHGNSSNTEEDVKPQTRPLFLEEDESDPSDELKNLEDEVGKEEDEGEANGLDDNEADVEVEDVGKGQIEESIGLNIGDVGEDEEPIDEIESEPLIIDEDVPGKELFPTITHLNKEAPNDDVPIEHLDKEVPVPLPKEVSRDANGIPVSEKAFWSKTRNKKVKKVKEQIEAEFGDRYDVVVCRKKNPSPKCNMRNMDFSRVRIWVRKQSRVKKIVIG